MQTLRKQLQIPGISKGINGEMALGGIEVGSVGNCFLCEGVLLVRFSLLFWRSPAQELQKIDNISGIA